MPKISIIIPCLNEEKYIKNCLSSIIDSEYNKNDLEVLVVDGMSSDKTLEIVQEFSRKYTFIKLLDNVKKIAPVAMNIGIKEAQGEYIIRLDAHAFYPKDYFDKLISWHQKLDADNIGAVIITDVKHENLKSNAIKRALSSKFGVGNSEFRTGVAEIKEVDTVPFGCYRKEVFQKYGYYDERLVRNQDIELNKRIINGGGKIYLVPDVQCTYYARENFTALAKNNYANGKWNILTAYYTKTFNSLSIRHFVPLIFILSIVLPSLLIPLSEKFLYAAIVPLLSYSTLVIIASIKLRNSSNNIIYLMVSFFTLHFSYGIGSLVGIFTVIKKIIKGEK